METEHLEEDFDAADARPDCNKVDHFLVGGGLIRSCLNCGAKFDSGGMEVQRGDDG